MNPFIEAARPKTLFNALAPVLVGTAVGWFGQLDPNKPLSLVSQPTFQTQTLMNLPVFLLALLVSTSATVAVNYGNDLFDGLAGNDGEERTGPRRVVAAGLVTPRAMAIAFGIALVLFVLSGLLFIALTGAWALLPVGVVCCALLYAYSGGPYPLASHGLGEVAVFLTFGLAATVGTAYAISGQVLYALPYGAAVGVFSCAVLEANNIRDIPQDTENNKRTVAVRLGDAGARELYRSLMMVPYLVTFMACFHVGAVFIKAGQGWLGLVPALSLISLPFAIACIRKVMGGAKGPDLIALIPKTGLTMTLWAMFIAIGFAWPCFMVFAGYIY